MSLTKYKEKRSFDKTPEPTGGKPTEKKLRFVVQKHHASHLHYDFRLEMQGVLKSWAVPKGPSMNPHEKRLAMMVEDHPWDYRNFEGIIPEGYGAGTVIVWDEGTYEPADKKKTKEENEKELLHHLYQSSISIVLKGKKLKGGFSLVKTQERGENAWLLIKKEDEFATKSPVAEMERSVISGKTLEEVKKNPSNSWKSNRESKVAQSEPDKAPGQEVTTLLKKAHKSKFPSVIKPMLCSLIKKPFDDPAYLYEVKFDGFRIISSVKNGAVILSSRSGLNYTDKYPQVVWALQAIAKDMVLDGEIVALNKEGKPDFDALQNESRQNPLAIYLFDILWFDGYDLTGLSLLDRKFILSKVIDFNDVIKFSDHFEEGIKLFDLMKQNDMEGVVAKRKLSTYQPGKRGKDWLKLPAERRQEFVIGGWTESDSASPFASLLFGYYKDGKLLYQGHAGGGFKGGEKKKIKQKLDKLATDEKPFYNDVDTDRIVHWTKPQLVANIKFATYTKSGKIRKPAIFLGFREDKAPQQVIEETTVQPEIEKKVKKSEPALSEDSNWKIIDEEKITSKGSFRIEENEVVLTNVEKELWPGVSKAALIEYYHSVASYILPYLVDRPESLHIKNIKPTAPGLYIKDMEGRQPEWAQIFSTKRKHRKKGKRDTIDYLVCQNEATLLFMVNLGCIDINPWTSRIQNYQQPDFIIIDLDPSDDDFKKVITIATCAKKVFDKLKIKSFPKTSGKTGMHLYIPCENFTFPQARKIAENICTQIHDLAPEISTTEVTISKRGNKLYIDPNQNDEADTVAAAYSVRPAALPLVSTPLEWREINEKLDPRSFTIHTILKRIEKKGDLFMGVLDKKTRLKNYNSLKNIL